jgi:hypothetical protein
MAIYDHAAARHRIFVNGALAQEWPSKGAIGTEPGHPADNLKLRVGVGLNPANFAHFNGDIAEVMIYDHALTLSERTAIEGYLGQKYGVSLLPPIPTTGQKLWLHANAGVLRDANNISVTNWLDQSPSRNHALQPPGTTLHPSYVLNALNGKPVIRFDGVNDYLKCLIQADLGAKTSGSWLAVVKPTGGGVSQILENRQIDMAWRGGEQVFAADVFRIPGWVDPGNGPLTPGGYGPDSPYAILCIYDGVLGKHRIYVNGTLVTETPASPAAISSASAVAEERKLKIGSFFNGTSYSLPFTGDITEVLIYDRGLTAAERQTIDQYLASKYGTLDLDFDEDHVIDSQDIDPNDPSLGRLTITIEQPANGSTIN